MSQYCDYGTTVTVSNCYKDPYVERYEKWASDFREYMRDLSRAAARALEAAARLLAINPRCPEPQLAMSQVYAYAPARCARSSPPPRFRFYQGEF